MITSDIFTALRRRWYVVLLGLLATALVMVHVHDTSGVYSAQRNVRMVAPGNIDDDNTLVRAPVSLIALAGLVDRRINGKDEMPATASPDVSLADRGVHHGSAIFLPNDGGQWTFQFNRPELIVQAAGSSPEEVMRRVQASVERIQRMLTTLQRDDAVAGRVEARVVVPTSAIAYSRGRPMPALGASLLLGLGLTASAAVVVDRLAGRRRRRVRSGTGVRLPGRLPSRLPGRLGGART